ncbi:hypothetical protein [Salinarimonas sp.]|uniref:hypothetical protein n=1 Tax=Salinarimonas sp. TaxID=2766526 RepID=UPI0032D92CFB
MSAALSGVLAGAVGALAIVQESFWLLAAAHALLGLFLASVNLFRFAALDLVPGDKRPSAVSLVLFGGVFAALLGSFLARAAPVLIGASLFAASASASTASWASGSRFRRRPERWRSWGTASGLSPRR